MLHASYALLVMLHLHLFSFRFMADMTLGCSFILVLLCYQVLTVDIGKERHFIAAVYEHHVILSPDPITITNRQSALQLMNRNLDIYEEQIIAAVKQVQQPFIII